MTMLQLGGIFINLSVRHTSRVPLLCASQQLMTDYSTVSNLKPESVDNSNSKISSDKKQDRIPSNVPIKVHKGSKPVKLDLQEFFTKSNVDVEKLLSSSKTMNLSPKTALLIFSKLSALVKDGKAKISDFESDERYKAICRFLSVNSFKNKQGEKINEIVQFHNKELGFLFSMNEIQKAIDKPNLSITEAVQFMSKLVFYKSRIAPVLQALANHIINSNEKMGIKVASDILYNMSVLNFYDQGLIQKLVGILNSKIPLIDADTSSLIGSILKSIGLLRYRNEELLSHLTTWMLNNYKNARPQDICSFLVTLAILDYTPKNNLPEFQTFTNHLKEVNASDAADWLDIVWALVILNQAQETQVMSVLSFEFLQKLKVISSLTELKKRKILNINAVAKLVFKQNTDKFYTENSSNLDVSLEKNRSQQVIVKGIITSLHAFLPSTGCLNIDVNTGMGFSLDAEFYVDKNINPILLSQVNSKENELLKLAVQSLSYYDYCRGEEKVSGPIRFQNSLLRLSDYHVIPVSYSEFQLKKKVVDRAKYLKNLINETVKQDSV